MWHGGRNELVLPSDNCISIWGTECTFTLVDQGFSASALLTFLGYKILFWGNCQMLSIVVGLYSMCASSTPWLVATQNVSRHCQMFPGEYAGASFSSSTAGPFYSPAKSKYHVAIKCDTHMLIQVRSVICLDYSWSQNPKLWIYKLQCCV